MFVGFAPRREWSSFCFLHGLSQGKSKKAGTEGGNWRHSKKPSVYNKLTLGIFLLIFAYL